MPQVATTVLIVDDHASFRSSARALLEAEGFRVVGEAEDAAGGLAGARELRPDLVLLDVQLPKVDGLTLLRRLKLEQPDLPVVMLTAKGDLPDRLSGLEGGADDYIVKPVQPAELLARVKAVLRRSKRELPSRARDVLTASGLRLDMLNLTVAVPGGGRVQLTPTEARILHRLMISPNSIVSREELTESAVGQDAAITAKHLDVHIANIRRKLGDNPRSPRYIRTFRGYLFLSHSVS